MHWIVQDIKDLNFPPASFDVVIEKATIDALLVNERDPWRLSDDACRMTERILDKVVLFYLSPFFFFIYIQMVGFALKTLKAHFVECIDRKRFAFFLSFRKLTLRIKNLFLLLSHLLKLCSLLYLYQSEQRSGCRHWSFPVHYIRPTASPSYCVQSTSI